MDSFLKKIFEGQDLSKDDLVHAQFQKFSKGEFNDKAGFILKRSKDKFALSTTPEYGNELVHALAEEIGSNKVGISGALITTIDLSEEYDFKEVKNALGVRKHFIEGEMSGEEIIALQEKFPKAFFALNFSTPTSEIKIKVKAPKTKPSGKGESKPKIDFCKLKTTNEDIVKNIAFDIDLDAVRKAEVIHDFIIEDIIKPKGETDFAKIRELAKRKGKIVRKITIDEVVEEKQSEFEA
jgi:hypothetical protein